MFEQSGVEPHTLTVELLDIIKNPQRRASMQQALERWDRPTSASEIADRILGLPPQIDLPPQSGEIRATEPSAPASVPTVGAQPPSKEQEALNA
jgi:hypothetical protein